MVVRVTAQIDLMAFPLEIAEQMLNLGKAFNMTLGVVPYNEAEIKLEIWLQVLSQFRTSYIDFETVPLSHQSMLSSALSNSIPITLISKLL